MFLFFFSHSIARLARIDVLHPPKKNKIQNICLLQMVGAFEEDIPEINVNFDAISNMLSRSSQRCLSD